MFLSITYQEHNPAQMYSTDPISSPNPKFQWEVSEKV